MITTAPTIRPQRTNTDITVEIRDIAREALDASKGRTTYDYILGKEKSESGTGIIGVSAQQIRDRFADDPIAQAKLRILWLLLHPNLDLVGRTARRNPAVSDYMQERVRVRLEEILEQKVLQNPPSGLDLNMLVNPTPQKSRGGNPALGIDGKPQMRVPADPVGWARQLLFGSLAVTTRRVFNNEVAQLSDFSDVINPDGTAPRLITRQVLQVELPISAEDQYLGDRDELDRIGEDPESALERWQADSEGKRGVDRLRLGAQTIIETFGLNAAVTPSSNTDRRTMLAAILDDPTLPVRSLSAFHDLSSGRPTWDQRDVSDGLLALWAEYTPEQSERLMDMDDRVAGELMRAALALPARPGRDALRTVCNTLCLASKRAGWNAVVRRALDSWVADHFSLTNDFDYRSAGDVGANEALAFDWEAAADSVLAWPGRPAGSNATTSADVHRWITRVLAAG